MLPMARGRAARRPGAPGNPAARVGTVDITLEDRTYPSPAIVSTADNPATEEPVLPRPVIPLRRRLPW
jgi:hypothetical protein